MDFMGTVCRLLGVDHHKEVTTSNGRPIRIVDKNAQLIDELIS